MRRKRQEIAWNLRQGATVTIGWWRRSGILCLLLAATAIASPAQDEQPLTKSITFTTLTTFVGTNGAFPEATLVQGTDGNLYGTTAGGGINNDPNCQEYPNGCGTVFKITLGGTLTALYNFCAQPNCADGNYPSGGLTQAADGSFYGTTYFGGSSLSCTDSRGCGTVFKITPQGTLTTLYNFCSRTDCSDGTNPDAALTQATDGNFYGIAQNGGLLSCEGTGCGTIFKITPQGVFTVLHAFDPDGGIPLSTLIQATDGNFYGVGQLGGAYFDGTVFKITPSGDFTTLHSFDGTDGSVPVGGLVEAYGAFYGTTSQGGTGANCPPTGNAGCGTVFKIAPDGTLTTLYNFCSQTDCSDGNFPQGALAQGTDGNFYGSTVGFLSTSLGTVFRVTQDGRLTTLHSFDGTDGSLPLGGLFQATNGGFYGATDGGGTDGYGTVFALSVGLGPFVETLPTSGKVGTVVKILGTDLTEAASVSFNGTPAAFRLVSHSLMSAAVPDGATSGFVTVSVGNTTLKSNVQFQVRP
ncbi:MAG TPA: choice-of-anchor tandem repeat GloVer-containing protein [Terriglobia bacterium]|nr:choice-of-anchor tandem repeat GloVer-containing protein [Terriglobia bacterium]